MTSCGGVNTCPLQCWFLLSNHLHFGINCFVMCHKRKKEKKNLYCFFFLVCVTLWLQRAVDLSMWTSVCSSIMSCHCWNYSLKGLTSKSNLCLLHSLNLHDLICLSWPPWQLSFFLINSSVVFWILLKMQWKFVPFSCVYFSCFPRKGDIKLILSDPVLLELVSIFEVSTYHFKYLFSCHTKVGL